MRKFPVIYGPLAIGILVMLLAPAIGMYIYNQQKVKIVLNVPDSYEIGELVVLDASDSDVDEMIWQIFPATPNFKVVGKVAYFSSMEPIDYKLILVARNNKDMACRTFNLLFTKVKILPMPVFTEFEQIVSKWNRPQNKDAALDLAQSFKIVGQMIESGMYDTVDGIIIATARANKTSLGNRLEAWKPFLIEFQNYLENNPPLTIEAHSEVWQNMANALEKIYA